MARATRAAPRSRGPSRPRPRWPSSLKQVARKGLVVHYSVNEQVAGRFEVLLDAVTAHRLGISGPVATGLAPGSPKSLVIGHALLVTTKGGRSSVRIKFSKSTAKHLRRAHKVKLTLRLVVRNASSQKPALHDGDRATWSCTAKARVAGTYNPGQWRATKPAFERISGCQREANVPLRPTVS